LTIDDIVKFNKDDKMKYLVVEYTNGCFYGFNLVVKNERQTATNIVTDVDNDFTMTGWRRSKKLPSWALSYQEWKSFISAADSYHDGEIEAFAVGNRKDESEEETHDSSSDDIDESMDSSDGNYETDRETGNASNKKKAGANSVCDWGQAIHCNLTSLPPLKCQKDGCNHLVHHLCKGNWEQSNGHSDTVARYCFNHHPSYMSNGDVSWDDDELLNIAGKTVDSKVVCLQGNTVNNGFVENIQNFGGDDVIHQFCVKSAETIPFFGGETWQGMPTNINSNVNAVAHCRINTAGNVANTLPLCGIETWQGMPMNINSNINGNVNPLHGGDTGQGMPTNFNSNINTVAHSGINIAGNF
jgi:hypothetical protein